MINTQVRTIELKENDPNLFDADNISQIEGMRIYEQYDLKGYKISVEFPTPKTNNCWKLTAKNWVGHISITPKLQIIIHPKIKLINLFRMFEYAYKIPESSFCFLEGLAHCQSIEDFFGGLAKYLTFQILSLSQKGLYKAYEEKKQMLPYIRGRVDINSYFHFPWKVKLRCSYQDITIDNQENQILIWTLYCIAHNELCPKDLVMNIRQAYRILRNTVSLRPYSACDLNNRSYNNLNRNYQQLHAICRFFLDHSGPFHEIGAKKMVPFLVEMPHLYQLFIAEWLKTYLPQKFTIKYLDRISIGNGALRFEIDMVIYDSYGNSVCVLDAKYKSKLEIMDVHQIHTYADIKNCQNAILVYPMALTNVLDTNIRNIRVRSLNFTINADIEEAGQKFLEDLLKILGKKQRK